MPRDWRLSVGRSFETFVQRLAEAAARCRSETHHLVPVPDVNGIRLYKYLWQRFLEGNEPQPGEWCKSEALSVQSVVAKRECNVPSWWLKSWEGGGGSGGDGGRVVVSVVPGTGVSGRTPAFLFDARALAELYAMTVRRVVADGSTWGDLKTRQGAVGALISAAHARLSRERASAKSIANDVFGSCAKVDKLWEIQPSTIASVKDHESLRKALTFVSIKWLKAIGINTQPLQR